MCTPQRMNALLSLEERDSFNNPFCLVLLSGPWPRFLLVLLLFLRDERGGLAYTTDFQHGEQDLKKYKPLRERKGYTAELNNGL